MTFHKRLTKSLSIVFPPLLYMNIWYAQAKYTEISTKQEKVFECKQCVFNEILMKVSALFNDPCCGIVWNGKVNPICPQKNDVIFYYSDRDNLTTQIGAHYDVTIEVRIVRGVMVFIVLPPGQKEELNFPVFNFEYSGKTLDFMDFVNKLYQGLNFWFDFPAYNKYPATMRIGIPGQATFYDVLVEIGKNEMTSWCVYIRHYRSINKGTLGGNGCIWTEMGIDTCSRPKDAPALTWEEWH